MKTFRYDLTGRWFKGNTHLHSTASDGGKTFAELAELYTGAGYDFLVRTDHWVASDTRADSESYPLVWLDGIELDGHDESGQYAHVVCVGPVPPLNPADGFRVALEQARAAGALLIHAHPLWCDNQLDYTVRHRLHGVEIYNHVCRWLNGKSDGLTHWNAALGHDPETLGLAVDDGHLRAEHPGWNGGWVMVNAPANRPEDLLAALAAGRFYSSCGPRIERLDWDGRQLRVHCSPVQFVRLVGPGPLGERLGSFDQRLLTDVTIPVPLDWDYVYLELEDAAGRRAWTNTLLTGA